MSLTNDEIRHLAKLARIELSDEEVASFTRELPAILSFIGELKSVDTEGIEPATGGGELANSLRADEMIDPLGDPDELKSHFIKTERGYLAVPRVFPYGDR